MAKYRFDNMFAALKDLRAENERLNKIIVDVVKQRDEAEHAMTNHEIRANDIEKKLEERQAEIDETIRPDLRVRDVPRGVVPDSRRACKVCGTEGELLIKGKFFCVRCLWKRLSECQEHMNAMPRRESLYPSPRQPSEAFFAQNVETEQMANDRKLAAAVRKLRKDGRLSLYEKWHPMFASRKMPLTSEQDLIEAAKETEPTTHTQEAEMPEKFETLCDDIRGDLKETVRRIRGLTEHPVFNGEQKYQIQHSEMKSNVMLSLRCAEDAAMRLGKAIQAAGDGVSILDKMGAGEKQEVRGRKGSAE